MYDENTNEKYHSLSCANCDKYVGLYYSPQPELFKDNFFCSIKCHDESMKKKKDG